MKGMIKKIIGNLFTYRDNRQLDKRKVIIQKKKRKWY